MGTKRLNATMANPPTMIQVSAVPQQDKSVSQSSAEKPKPVGSEPQIFFMEDLRDRRAMFNFLELSYRGGPRYKYGQDWKGMNVLIEHENERVDLIVNPGRLPTASDVVNRSEASLKSDKFSRRQRTASYVNFAKPIEDKFRSYVFSVPPSRPKDEGITKRLSAIKIESNVDEMLADGLKFTEAWIGFDAKRIVPPDGKTSVTVEEAWAQDPEFGGDTYIVRVDPRNVVDFSETAGTVTRVVIEEVVSKKESITSPKTSEVFYREWTESSWTLYKLVMTKGGQTSLIRVDGAAHVFGCCPFRRVVIPFPTEDICDLNRQHFNVSSLLDEEMYQNTFSQRVVTGAKPEDILTSDRGAGNTMVLPDPDAKISVVSGDSNQAAALMERLLKIQQSIFELVSLDVTNKSVAESAEKKKRDLEPLYSVLKKISKTVEDAENWLLVKMGIYAEDDESQRTKYSQKFDIYTIDDLIVQLSDLAKASFAPASLKRRLSVMLAQKVDPFGPHEEYEKDVEKMFDSNPAIVDAMMTLKREGSLTPEMLVRALGVPDDLAHDLIEMMDHPDPNADPNAPSSGPSGGTQDPEDEVPSMPGDGGDGPSGDGNGPGSGTQPESDSGPSGAADKSSANTGKGKARRVRRRQPKSGNGGGAV